MNLINITITFIYKNIIKINYFIYLLLLNLDAISEKPE